MCNIFLGLSKGPNPPENPTDPTRQVLGGSENIQVEFWVSISGYFRVRVGVDHINILLQPNFFLFEKNPTSLLFSLRLPQLYTSLKEWLMVAGHINEISVWLTWVSTIFIWVYLHGLVIADGGGVGSITKEGA